jgi:hypothetical protein
MRWTQYAMLAPIALFLMGQAPDAAVPVVSGTLPPVETLPGGQAGVVFYIAVAINRLLWFLRKFPKLMPKKYHRYTPLIAAVLGLVAGILQAQLMGSGWVQAILTGISGAAGAVAWREFTRQAEKKPPEGKDMSDDDLANAVSGD